MDNLQEAARRETCPKCGNTRMINNHYLEHQKHDRVLIECAQCGHLVAKYILRNYIDPGFHYQQVLKLARKHQTFSSGRKTLENLQALQEKARTQFETVKTVLEKEDERALQELFSALQILEDSYQGFDE